MYQFCGSREETETEGKCIIGFGGMDTSVPPKHGCWKEQWCIQ